MSAYYTFDNGLPANQEPQLYWLNLSSIIKIDGFIPTSLLTTAALPSDTLLGKNFLRGTFFYDHSTLYAYAGIISNDTNGASNSMWAFNTTTNQWNITAVEGGDYQFNNSEGEYAIIPATGQSFYTGGWGIGMNGKLPGLVAFESGAHPSWNFDDTNTAGLAPPSILMGGMEYVRKGQKGVLIVFGGFDTSQVRHDQFGPGWNYSYRPMSEIYVYDIFANTWYNVNATGDIPGYRGEFCTVVTASPDDSSFQITVYGGWNLLEDQMNDDVYVLTVPSFRWIQINSQNNTETFLEGDVGRHRHMCNLWGDSQMIVTDGIVSGRPGSIHSSYNEDCNSTYTPFRALDTSTYVWQSEIVPIKNYTVPSAVYNVIGGTATGGATANSPQVGWPNSKLENIFSLTVPRDTFTATLSAVTSAAPTSTTTPPAPPAPVVPSKLKGSAVAGIVVGCVVGLALVSGVLFWYFRYIKIEKSASLATKETFAMPELSGEGKESRLIYEMAEGNPPIGELDGAQQTVELG